MIGERIMTVAELFQAVVPRYPELNGKVAIVTGSSQGIGRGIAVRLAAEQMRIVIAGLEVDEVGFVVNGLRELGIDAIGVPGDLRNEDQVARLVDKAVHHFGRVDVLVNNAADLFRVRLSEMKVELFDRQIAINVRAPLLLAQRVAMIMPEGGSIINISSVGGLRAHERAIPYDVTKGAWDSHISWTCANCTENCRFCGRQVHDAGITTAHGKSLHSPAAWSP